MPSASKREVERRRPGRDGDRVGRAHRARASASSNSSTQRPHRQLPAREHLRDRGELGLADVRPREPDRLGNAHVAHAAAPSRARYHAIVRSSPSSSSTLRLEPEQRPRLVHVRDPQLDVRVVERDEADLARAAGEPLDPRREVVDRDRRAGVADVEALADGGGVLEREQHRLDHVVDVAPGADLRAVAVDLEVASRERRLDERADRAAADLTRAVDVERTHRDRRQAELGVVGVRHVLAGELRDRVRPARLADRADRRHVALLDVERVLPEHLARRELDERARACRASRAPPRARCRCRSR